MGTESILNEASNDAEPQLRERWRGMIRRTGDLNHKAYPSYGGRGIKVCERWQKYENFLADVGPTFQDGLTLDRIDNDGNYEPSNIRWATPAEQSRNTRISRMVTWQGRTMHVADWAEELDINAGTLSRRLRRGWSIEQAFVKPKQPEPEVLVHRSRNIAWKGRDMHVSDWAAEVGISVGAIDARMRSGWPVERALTEPVRNQRNAGRDRALTWQGRTLSAEDWSAEVGISAAAILKRVDRGWSAERALTEPSLIQSWGQS